ncbi:MAG: D-alanine--D-alanine ligase [Acidobacteriota bacterium]|nr:D-alanine--D-alanine ligase [Acidobacteriota bacterium]
MTKLNLALVFGGRSPEHEVSLMSARGIHEHLDQGRFDILLVGVDRRGKPRLGGAELLEGAMDRGAGTPVRWPASPEDRTLRAEADGSVISPPVDVLFPIVHGAGGEDGTIQGVCELAGIACVGAGVLGSSLAMDKELSRTLLRAEGFPVVQSVVLRPSDLKDARVPAERVAALGYPVFVKPARAGSSVGITRVADAKDLPRAIDDARAFDSKLVVERAVVEPREIEVSVLGADDPRASVPGEVVPAGEFYDYHAKYEAPDSRLLIPAPIDDELSERIRGLATRGFRALDLAGMARVDFLLSKRDGSLVLNEINTLPGFTPISMYPRLWEASGLSYGKLLESLVEIAVEQASLTPLAQQP